MLASTDLPHRSFAAAEDELQSALLALFEEILPNERRGETARRKLEMLTDMGCDVISDRRVVNQLFAPAACGELRRRRH